MELDLELKYLKVLSEALEKTTTQVIPGYHTEVVYYSDDFRNPFKANLFLKATRGKEVIDIAMFIEVDELVVYAERKDYQCKVNFKGFVETIHRNLKIIPELLTKEIEYIKLDVESKKAYYKDLALQCAKEQGIVN